jgi:hypothetical protein
MATNTLAEIMGASSAGADRIKIGVAVGTPTGAPEAAAHRGSLTIEIGVPLALLREVEKRVKEGEQVIILGGNI